MSDKQNLWNLPSKLSLWDKMIYLRLRRPNWANHDGGDDLKVLYDHLESLLANGIVVWGHIIQVNEDLFESGSEDLPGEVVYSIDDSQVATPIELGDVAHNLYRLKGTVPEDPKLYSIANYLTNEYIRVFGLQVPSIVSPSLRCRISTTMFIRKHLPRRRVSFAALPIIVNPTEPNIVLPLPFKYWSDGLRNELIHDRKFQPKR